MPEIMRKFGMKFFFYSREHEPIHVHVRNTDGKAKFRILPQVELMECIGIKQKDIKMAKQILEMEKEYVIQQWNNHFGIDVRYDYY